MKLPKGEYITLKEYATEQGISAVAALKRVKKGILKAYKVGSYWVVRKK